MKPNIKEYREKKKLSQSEFARQCKLSRQIINYHEQNPNSRWSANHALKIEEGTDKEITAYDLVFN